ncbi:MAG: hypothetical protein EP329_15810, partial [Deltaproteobacteria bacterium]
TPGRATPAEPAPAAAATPPPAQDLPAAAFTTPDGLTASGEVALRWLADAHLHGVDAPLPEAVVAWRTDHDPAKRPAAEDALTDAVTRLAAALAPQPNTLPVLQDADGYYSSPDTLWLGVAPPEPTADLRDAVLDAARAGTLDAFLSARLPTEPQYTRLVAAARRYEALCGAGGWAPLPVPGAKTRRGSRWKDTAAVTALQRRLALEGYLSGDPTGVYDEPTADAVERFRAARAVWAKRYFDAEAAEALNVPCQDRLATLLLNVRRWRHTARVGEDTYVRVNLPEAIIRYVRAGELRLVHRAVVGSGKTIFHRTLQRDIRRNATPVMHDAISNVVLNPEWKVPVRLAREEIGPAIDSDPTYAERHGFRIVTAANGQKMYVQAHGPDNALGQVKLTFPNSEAIYLHGTPKQGYFRYPRRDFSHGCVRVKGIVELGLTLLQDDFEARGERLSERLMKDAIEDNEKTIWYGLEQPVPIFIEYYTASVDDDGLVHFHPDIYDYDAATLKALAGQ